LRAALVALTVGCDRGGAAQSRGAPAAREAVLTVTAAELQPVERRAHRSR
jgi:hypothetical protein